MLRFSSVEESRIVYKASPPGEQYCLQVVKDPSEPTANGMRVKLMRSDSNVNSLQLWSLSPDDRILFASDPGFCLHVMLDQSHSDAVGVSAARGAAYNGARLCVWRVEKHYKKQGQQLWLQGPDERIRLASHRQFCIMLWDPVPSVGQRVDLWKANTGDLTAQQFITTSEEAPYLPPLERRASAAATKAAAAAARAAAAAVSSAADPDADSAADATADPEAEAKGLRTSSAAATTKPSPAVAPGGAVKSSAARPAAAAAAPASASAAPALLSPERVAQLLDLLDADLAAGAVTHAQYLNIAEKLDSKDAAAHKQAVGLLAFYHRGNDGEDARARDDALAIASGVRATDGAIASALRQLDGCLVRLQVTKHQYDTLRASLTLGDAEEREAVSRAIEAMVPKLASAADWTALPARLWVRVCGYLTFTEAALLALVSKRVGEACSAHEIWYAKCLEYFSSKPAWVLPAERDCVDWKRYLHTYFTKWVPLELEKQKGQRMFNLRVAVRFKPLPEEEQAEKGRFMPDGGAYPPAAPRRSAAAAAAAANSGGAGGAGSGSYDDDDAPEGYRVLSDASAAAAGGSGPNSPRVTFGETRVAPTAAGVGAGSARGRSSAVSPTRAGAGAGARSGSLVRGSAGARGTSPKRGGAGGNGSGNGGSGTGAGGNGDEDGEDARSWVEIHQGKCEIVEVSELTASVRATVDDRPRHFQFHDVFAGTTTQKELYARLVWRMTRDVLFGYSATVFVYGQTASGKTWTMFGPSLVHPVTGQVTPADRSLWGVVPRSCEQILHTLNREHGTAYVFEVSYVEIYQDRIHDLLNGGARLQLVEDVASDRDFRLDNPMLMRATSMQDIELILATGERQKTVFATQMNERSSRSHCLFTITLTQTNVERNFREKNKFNLVDLAGSERQKKSLTHGKRFEEAKNINKSLATLERCILCLSNPNTSHIPYRDSELTKMLQQALGGYANCKRTLLVTCSRDHAQVLETLSTLRFAYRARHIQQGKKKSHI